MEVAGNGFERTVSHQYRPEGNIEKARKASFEDDARISGFLRRGFSIFRGINPSGHEETSEMAKRGSVLGEEREEGKSQFNFRDVSSPKPNLARERHFRVN